MKLFPEELALSLAVERLLSPQRADSSNLSRGKGVFRAIGSKHMDCSFTSMTSKEYHRCLREVKLTNAVDQGDTIPLFPREENVLNSKRDRHMRKPAIELLKAVTAPISSTYHGIVLIGHSPDLVWGPM
jgi:hypothetical protein